MRVRDDVGEAMARFSRFQPFSQRTEWVMRNAPLFMSVFLMTLGLLWIITDKHSLHAPAIYDNLSTAFAIWVGIFFAYLLAKVFWYNSQKRKLFQKRFPLEAMELGM
jgi:hypothetical protein